jgi:hypothetical protein
LTTPAGVLATFVAVVLIAGPSIIAGQHRVLRRWHLARAVDVTDVPPWVWLARPPVRPGETRADRWLGRSRRTRMASVTLLAAAAVLTLLVVAGICASGAWALTLIHGADCETHGCPPQYLILPQIFASEWVALGLASLANYLWLGRVEASSGIRLRLRGWLVATRFLYIRQPGVTPEGGAAALARFTPTQPMPMARVFAITVLSMLPLFLMFIIVLFLQLWLPTQWIAQ